MNLIGLLKEKFNLKQDWEIDGVGVYSNEEILLQCIEPHKGTEWKTLIRADYRETFDRWSVAWYDKYINNIYDAKEIEECLNDIDLILKNKNKVLIKTPTDDELYEEGYYYDLNDDELEKLNLSIEKE